MEAGKLDELNEMNINELRALCKKEGLDVVGKKAELVKRLVTKLTGRSDRYAGQLTKCAVCNMPVRVKKTQRLTDQATGKVTIVRTIQCTSKHRHTYNLTEKV